MNVTKETIVDLDRRLVSQAENFKNWFLSKFPNEKIDDHLDRNWTLFMLGKAKGMPNTDWKGVIPEWINQYVVPPDLSVSLEYESWYRVDLAVVEYFSEFPWWVGKYRIQILLEHENNPAEIVGHTRSLLDFNVPEKILITWTNDKQNDPQELLDRASKAIDWCRQNSVHLVGKLTVLVGDWNVIRQTLYTGEDIHLPVLHYREFQE